MPTSELSKTALGPPPDLLGLRLHLHLLPLRPSRHRLHPPRHRLVRPDCLRFGWPSPWPSPPLLLMAPLPPPQSRHPPQPHEPPRVPMSPEVLHPPLGCGTRGRKNCGPATARCCQVWYVGMFRTKKNNGSDARSRESGTGTGSAMGTGSRASRVSQTTKREKEIEPVPVPGIRTYKHIMVDLKIPYIVFCRNFNTNFLLSCWRRHKRGAVRPKVVQEAPRMPAPFNIALSFSLQLQADSLEKKGYRAVDTEPQAHKTQVIPDPSDDSKRPPPLTSACGSGAHRGGTQSFPWRARSPPPRQGTPPPTTRCRRSSPSPLRLPAP